MFYQLTTTDQDGESKWASNASYKAGEAMSIMVVRAGSESEARKTAAAYCSCVDPKAWLDETTIVELLDGDGPPEVLGSF